MRLQSNKPCTFNEFTSMMCKLLEAAWGCEWGTFMEAYPNGTDPKNVNLPIITYKSKGKKPATMGNGAREIKPRLRTTHQETVNGRSQSVNVYGQTFEQLVEFNVWAGTNGEAERLAEQFEDFMMMFTGYFLQNGVQGLFFLEQFDTTDEVALGDNAVVRSFRYLLRIEKHLEVATGNITEIIGRAGILNPELPNDSIDEESIHFKIQEGGNTQ